MKQIKLFFVAFMLFAGATSFVNAQSNIAHINTQELVEAMPKMKAAQNQLKKLQETYDAEIQTMAKELDTKIKLYDAEAENKTEEENQKRVVEVQGMQKKIGEYRNNALKDLQQKEIDLMQPLLEEARAAIQKVATAQGIQYVLDSAAGNGVIVSDGKDLLLDVKKELGI